jgi:hypothetical protein
MAITCSNCNSEQLPDSNFCDRCGNQLPPELSLERRLRKKENLQRWKLRHTVGTISFLVVNSAGLLVRADHMNRSNNDDLMVLVVTSALVALLSMQICISIPHINQALHKWGSVRICKVLLERKVPVVLLVLLLAFCFVTDDLVLGIMCTTIVLTIITHFAHKKICQSLNPSCSAPYW